MSEPKTVVQTIMQELRANNTDNSESWIIKPESKEHGLSDIPAVGDYSQHEYIRAMQKNLLLDVVEEMLHIQLQHSTSDATLTQNVQRSKNNLYEAYLAAMPQGHKDRERTAKNFANADEQRMFEYLGNHQPQLQAAAKELGFLPTAEVVATAVTANEIIDRDQRLEPKQVNAIAMQGRLISDSASDSEIILKQAIQHWSSSSELTPNALTAALINAANRYVRGDDSKDPPNIHEVLLEALDKADALLSQVLGKSQSK